ncbi:hypothetical protein SM139_3650 [Stenotrophomonas maltophilia]|nr:hypothetical protein SM139_3650 [Stenotrophomonas maltophilia]
MAHRQARGRGFATFAGLQERQHALDEGGQLDRTHAVPLPLRWQQPGQLTVGGQRIKPGLLLDQLLHRPLQHHVVGQRDLRQAMARRRQVDGGLAGSGVIQQRLLRRQGYALACSTLGQLTGGFGQSFGVVAVHGRSGRLHRRDVD